MLCTETSISNLKPLDLKVCGGEAVFACGKTSECWMVLEVPFSQGVITIKDFLFLLWFVQKNKNGWWSGGRAEIKHTTTLLLSLLTLHHSFTQSRFRFVYLDVGLFAFFFCEKKKKTQSKQPQRAAIHHTLTPFAIPCFWGCKNLTAHLFFDVTALMIRWQMPYWPTPQCQQLPQLSPKHASAEAVGPQFVWGWAAERRRRAPASPPLRRGEW